MKLWWLYFAVSLAVIIPGSYSLIRYGLKLGIDFTGGTNIVWSSPDISEDVIRELANKKGIELKEVTKNNNTWTFRTAPMSQEEYQSFKLDFLDENVDLATKSNTFKELSYDTIGPSLGSELLRKTLYGISLAAGLILLYVAYRFKNLKFGLSAIIAMLHDSLVVLGVFSLLGHFQGVEVDTLFVTALLTILSFSVHDTIVVYDRIRELKKKHGGMDFDEIVNRAVVETLGRSLNNSMTIIFMLLAMYLMGGDTTKWFIFALLIGTISGTYSSTFTAAPVLVVWDRLDHTRKLNKINRKK